MKTNKNDLHPAARAEAEAWAEAARAEEAWAEAEADARANQARAYARDARDARVARAEARANQAWAAAARAVAAWEQFLKTKNQEDKKMETKTKHTPGPWRCMEVIPDAPRYTGETIHVIVDGGNRNVLNKDYSVTEANAALIAAAPDLLAALELVKAHDRSQITGGDWDIINAAIAKAKTKAI